MPRSTFTVTSITGLITALSIGAAPLADAAAPSEDGGPGGERTPRVTVTHSKNFMAVRAWEIAYGIEHTLADHFATPLWLGDQTKEVEQMRLGRGAVPQAAVRTLARFGKDAGADYVLHVQVTKSGWKHSARAVLIDTKAACVAMDFTSGYFKPRQEALDRGERIGRKAVEKLRALTEKQGVPPALPADAQALGP